jgi:hypothetical protein
MASDRSADAEPAFRRLRDPWLGIAGDTEATPDSSFSDFYTIQHAATAAIGHGCRDIFPKAKAEIVIASSTPTSSPVELPPLVAAFIEATNRSDVDRILATFAEDALVNDQLRDYWGKSSIRHWAERDLVGEKLTIKVTKVVNHYGNCIVTADIDGNFDKRGLPDPFVLAFYFATHGNLLVQLIILRNRYDI